ncbi:phosphotransferase [Phenylobacterium sp. LjRoot219]|uniref:phosphotransferase n=1 Tax=Phenylobacterium sp. LjRoot219 TaxID=3342283 RepID=UPI003ED017FC
MIDARVKLQRSPRISALDHTWIDVRARIGRGLGSAEGAAQLIEDHPVKPGRLHRQVWRTGELAQSVIVKRFTPEQSRVERLALERWLPALQLADLAPELLAVVGKPDAACVWHVYEDLSDGALKAAGDQGVRDRSLLPVTAAPPQPDRLAFALASLARLHRASASHPLLDEYCYWTRGLGGHFLLASVQGAIAALEALRPDRLALTPHRLQTRDALLAAVRRLQAEAADRCAQLAAFGGPDCLLHGDCGDGAAMIGADGVGRLITWRHAGVGPASFDLSALLGQLPKGERGAALERYRQERGCATADWPNPATWNALFDTAERSRLADGVIGPALSALDGEGDSAFIELAAIAARFEALQPLLGPTPA